MEKYAYLLLVNPAMPPEILLSPEVSGEWKTLVLPGGRVPDNGDIKGFLAGEVTRLHPGLKFSWHHENLAEKVEDDTSLLRQAGFNEVFEGMHLSYGKRVSARVYMGGVESCVDIEKSNRIREKLTAQNFEYPIDVMVSSKANGLWYSLPQIREFDNIRQRSEDYSIGDITFQVIRQFIAKYDELTGRGNRTLYSRRNDSEEVRRESPARPCDTVITHGVPRGFRIVGKNENGIPLIAQIISSEG